jgi:hypothetical protein
MNLPTIEQLRNMPLSEINDISGKKRARTGATNSVKYKICDVDDAHCSQAIVAEYGTFSGGAIIRSCETGRWDQFLHRGM